MAAGDVTADDFSRAICILFEGAADSAAPSVATDGVAIKPIFRPECAPPNGDIMMRAVVDAGQVLTGQIRIWGYDSHTSDWYPLGIGMDAEKGKLNDGLDLGETTADKAVHTQPITQPGRWTRLFAQVLSSSGTGRKFSVYLKCSKNYVER